MPTPFAAIAADLETGREIWLKDGPIEDAARASISLPGIFIPSRRGSRWLIDGGLVNPVPVSLCGALGADIVIAVNLNGGLVQRFGEEMLSLSPRQSGEPSPEFLGGLLGQIPEAVRQQGLAIVPKLLRPAPGGPSYFEVLTNAINNMQDQITRARLAGEPPHAMLLPRLRQIRLLEFNRACEAIAEGYACAKEALPVIERYL